VLGVLRELDLERLLSRERTRERDLAVAMLCQLVIAPASKRSMTRDLTVAASLDDKAHLSKFAQGVHRSLVRHPVKRNDLTCGRVHSRAGSVARRGGP
jgi:hypothetical protein